MRHEVDSDGISVNSRLAWLQRVVRATEDGLLSSVLTATLLLSIGQILLRNIWYIGISWADPSLRVLVLWIALLGAMAATRNGNHIRIDLLPRYLSPRLRAISNRITDLFAASVCAILAWHAVRFVRVEYADGGLLFASVPAWACELILPVGFGIMALRFLLATLAGDRSGPERYR